MFEVNNDFPFVFGKFGIRGRANDYEAASLMAAPFCKLIVCATIRLALTASG